MKYEFLEKSSEKSINSFVYKLQNDCNIAKKTKFIKKKAEIT